MKTGRISLMLDKVLEVISYIMLVLAIYGSGIQDDATLSCILIGACMAWVGLLVLIANRSKRRRRNGTE